jgi:hypothetical protein
MSEKERRAISRVQVLVEVTGGVWGPECTLKQAHEHAQREALQQLELKFQSDRTVRVLNVVVADVIFREGV